MKLFGGKKSFSIIIVKNNLWWKISSYIYINLNLPSGNCILTKVFQAKEQNYVIFKTLGKRYVIDEEKCKKA